MRKLICGRRYRRARTWQQAETIRRRRARRDDDRLARRSPSKTTERDDESRGRVATVAVGRQGLRHGSAARAAPAVGALRRRARRDCVRAPVSTTTCASTSAPSPRRRARAPTRTTAATPLRPCSRSAARGSRPSLGDEDGGRREAGAMLEAAALSGAAAYALKQLHGARTPVRRRRLGRLGRGRRRRFRPCTRRPRSRSARCSRSPGNDRHRWVRRVLGYGLAVGTAYARMDHDAHWLSDTVAGAGLGIATARFVMKQRDRGDAARGDVDARAAWPTASRVGYTVDLRR